MRILVIYLQYAVFSHFEAGLTISDPVLRTNKPLSVELGPGNLWVAMLIWKRNYGEHFWWHIETIEDNC